MTASWVKCRMQNVEWHNDNSLSQTLTEVENKTWHDMTSWIGGETVHHIVDSCIVKRNPVNSPWHYPRTPLYKHSHLFTKILWILFSWGFLVTGNSCGFQPGIILELAKALSTSQKIIPSIRIKYEEIPFGTYLKKVPFSYFFCKSWFATTLSILVRHDE